MRELKPEEQEKIAEFIAQRAGAIHHLRTFLEKEFSESPEGLETIYLKGILEHYLNKLENFLAHFVSGPPGQRGIDAVINGLEHPQSKVVPDKKLLSNLKKLSEKIKKVKLPDFKEWQHYKHLQQLVSDIQLRSDIHEFINDFNSFLVRAVEYPETEVARYVKERNAKKIKKIIHMENFEFELTVWKFIFSRLYRPEQEAKAKEVIGSQSFEELDEKIANKLGISVDDFRKEIKECFPSESGKEDADMTNLRAFATKVAEQRTKNVFIRVLIKVGRGKQAAQLIERFGKKGAVKTDPKTANMIASLIMKIDNDTARKNVEIASRDELRDMISTMLDRMEKQLTKERDQFVEVISSRIKELEKAHSKNLAKVEKIQHTMSTDCERLDLESEGIGNMTEKAKMLVTSRRDYYVRASDITTVCLAHTLFNQFKRGWIKEPFLQAEVAKIRSGQPSDFAMHTINTLQDLHDKRIQNNISAEEYGKKMEAIDEFTYKLAAQIRAITSHQQEVSAELFRLRAEFSDAEQLIQFDLKRISEEASKDVRKISKMGIHFEQYKEELTPQDIAVLTGHPAPARPS